MLTKRKRLLPEETSCIFIKRRLCSLYEKVERGCAHVLNICLYNNHSTHLYKCQNYLTLQSDYHILNVSRVFDNTYNSIAFNFLYRRVTMADITNINQHKKGISMGKRLEADMNFDSTSLFNSINIDKHYPNSFYDVMKYIFESRRLLTMYDVGLIFNGIAQNDRVPNETQQLAYQICQNSDMFLMLKDDLQKHQSGVYGLKPNINTNKGRHLHIETYHYFKGIMEKPSKITTYDICALALSLETISQLKPNQRHIIYETIARSLKQKPKIYIQDKDAYEQSLMKRYINMPNKI